MKPSRIIVFWTAVIAVLLIVEVLEITHVFTLPIGQVAANPIAFVFALVFTTILALVGAIFIGVYISHRLLSPRGFTPFEEEMLKMRAEVLEIRREVSSLAGKVGPDPPARRAGDGVPTDPSEDRP